MLLIDFKAGKFVVKVNGSQAKVGTTRILTRAEIEELRQTKHSIAEHTVHAFKRA
jgi:hypothetical protein